jgi:NADH-quinone oxidoreductase subunit N
MFLLGIFPFHSWMPMLAEEATPYELAFVFFTLTLVVSFFGLGFLTQFPSLRSGSSIQEIIQSGGILMVVAGGVWSAFNRHLSRLLGFVMMSEIGFSMLTLSVGLSEQGTSDLLNLLIIQLLPRGLGLAVWALALNTMLARSADSTGPGEFFRFRNIQGAARNYPIASLAMILALFSLSGLPLLAGFPARLVLWSELARQDALAATIAFWGSAGLLVGGLRVISVIVMGEDESRWRISESWPEIVLLGMGSGLIIFMGIFPNLFFSLFKGVLESFGGLGQ